jgi:hypothetical protein
MSATYSMMEASFSAHGDELLSPSQASVLLPTHVYARLAWSQENNRKKQMEQRAQEEHRRILEERARALYRKTQGDRASRAGLDRAAVEAAHQRNWQIAQQERRIQKEDAMMREAARNQLLETVRQRKEQRMGRVAQSRSALLAHNRRVRQEEGRMEQFALDEKKRRLYQMKLEHQKELAKRFVMVDDRLLHTHPDSFRLLGRGGGSSRALSATTTRSMAQLAYRPASAADLRGPALSTSEHMFGAVGLRNVESTVSPPPTPHPRDACCRRRRRCCGSCGSCGSCCCRGPPRPPPPLLRRLRLRLLGLLLPCPALLFGLALAAALLTHARLTRSHSHSHARLTRARCVLYRRNLRTGTTSSTAHMSRGSFPTRAPRRSQKRVDRARPARRSARPQASPFRAIR